MNKLSFLCLLFFICACNKVQERDAWYSPIPNFEINGKGWNEIDRMHFLIPVDSENAILMLAENQYISLNQEALDRLMGAKVEVPAGKRPFLIRGLRCNAAPGRFTAAQKNGDIYVENIALGRRGDTMVRSPIVLLLAEEPRHLYVHCVLDE